MSKKSKLIVAALIERKSMNDPHKFGTEFGSDNAPEHSVAIVSHHDASNGLRQSPENNCVFGFTDTGMQLWKISRRFVSGAAFQCKGARVRKIYAWPSSILRLTISLLAPYRQSRPNRVLALR